VLFSARMAKMPTEGLMWFERGAQVLIAAISGRTPNILIIRFRL
jgi:hypothetical protein